MSLSSNTIEGKKNGAKAVPLSSFLSGSWDTYLLVNYDPSQTFTAGDVTEGMDVFKSSYKVNVIIRSHPDLVLWELQLEEKKKRRGTRRSLEGVKQTVLTKFRFAVNVEQELLFTNRTLSNKMRKELCKGLNCESLRSLSLSDSDPVNLLMLYKQAKERAPGAMKLQYQEKMCTKMNQILSGFSLSNDVEEMDELGKEIHLKLGSKTEEIPIIKKITVEIEDVPLMTKIPNLKGFRLQNVDLELSGGSIYHMYTYLGESGVINDISRWVTDTREKGKTHCKAKFS